MVSKGVFYFCILLITIVFFACGGAEEDALPQVEQPKSVEAFAQVFGGHETTFTLNPELAEVICRPKTAFDEFEYQATVKENDKVKSLHFVLHGFKKKITDYSFDYDPAKNKSQVEVRLDDRTKYVFFQSFRTDIDKVITSHCTAELFSADVDMLSVFKGSISCSMLWADIKSPDYQTENMNTFVDLIAKFECSF